MTGLGEGEFPANRLHCTTRFDETRFEQLNKKITEVAVECKATLNLHPSRLQRERLNRRITVTAGSRQLRACFRWLAIKGETARSTFVNS